MTESQTLWYTKPSKLWVEALPIGNGRIGAMVYGGVNEECIKLNEESLWSGYPKEKNNPEAKDYLAPIRNSMFKGDLKKAHTLTNEHMLGQWSETYLPFGTLRFQFHHTGPFTDYQRELNLKKAVTTVQYTCQNVQYHREMFCSNPDQLLVIRLQASSNVLSLDIQMESLLRSSSSVNENQLILQGKAPAVDMPNYYDCDDPVQYDDTKTTVSFEGRVKILTSDGCVTYGSDLISITDASEAVILVSLATSFVSFDQLPVADAKQRCKSYFTKTQNQSYEELLHRHLNYYCPVFDRMELNFGENRSHIPTDTRILEFNQGVNDPGLCALFFQYNRYLLISSSAPGSLAANLQGIWNQEMRPPWSSNYTININTEMNYWLSETCNLSEYTNPLFELILNLSKNGQKTAKLHYGCEGWVSHHNTDIWAQTAPVGPPGNETMDCTSFSVWPLSSGWLCRHLWDHYLYTGDETFLREKAMPVLLEACRFYVDYLIEDKNGHLVTGLSISPENEYEHEGERYHLDVMPAVDIAILKELFSSTLMGIDVTGIGTDNKQAFQQILSKLPDYQIGSKGQLLEWSQEYKETEPLHRHSSHLYCLYPSMEVTPRKTPELSKACKEALLRRGSMGTGWGQAWKVCLWARLYDGDKCYEMLKQIMRPADLNNKSHSDGSGLYINMFDAHPPFQIDGNFGASAGIAEMFVQSEPGFVHLLPALPTAFRDGSIKGLCCRGNLVVDLSFKDNQFDYAEIHSKKTQQITLKLKEREICVSLLNDQPITITTDQFNES